MDKGKSAMPLLAIVAIVAVVAVVMVVLQGRTPSSEEAVAGEAFRLKAPPTQVYLKGFEKACWSCHDGYGECLWASSVCRLPETWEEYATEACEGHGSGKCGVKSFQAYSACEKRNNTLFRKAEWTCYDGWSRQVLGGVNAPCRTSEEWQAKAEQYCEGRCENNGVKNITLYGDCRYG